MADNETDAMERVARVIRERFVSFALDPRFAEAYNLLEAHGCLIDADRRRAIEKEALEFSKPLYATRLVGHEKWQAEVIMHETGCAVGYTKPIRDATQFLGRRRVKLGYAMATVKEEDTVLLPLGSQGEELAWDGPEEETEYITMRRWLPTPEDYGHITTLLRGGPLALPAAAPADASSPSTHQSSTASPPRSNRRSARSGGSSR